MYHPEMTTDGKRWHPAPDNGLQPQTTGGIGGVYLADDEEVEWSIGYNPDGSQNVYGYTITKRGSFTLSGTPLIPDYSILEIDTRKLI